MRSGDRQALRTTDLRPDVWVIPHELHKQLELGAINRLAYIRPPHVVDDYGCRERGEEVPQLRKIHRFEVNHDVPAQFLDPAGNLDQLLPRRKINKALDEIEAHPAHAGVMHRTKLGVADAALYGRDTAGLAIGVHERVYHRAIVGAMTGGLHDDVSRKTKVVAQGEQLLLGSIAGSVFALRRIWKLRARTEHVTMRVHRARGDLETRPGWAWIPVEPARGLLKFH